MSTRTTPGYRAAIIGLGRIAGAIDDEMVGSRRLAPFSHLGAYREVPAIEVVGGADPHPQQRAAFAARSGLPPERVHESFERLLERERPDIVSVCTSAGPRARIVRRIAEMVVAGAARVRLIWAEKPLAVTLAEADAMVEDCRRAGIVLMMNAMRTSCPYYRRAQALIAAGEFGRMLQVTHFQGGHLSSTGSHCLPQMAMLAGPGRPRVAWAMGEAASDEAAASDGDLAANAYLGYDNGCRGFLRMLPCGPANLELEALGETGVLRVRNLDEEFEVWRMAQPFAGSPAAAVRTAFPRPQRIWSPDVGMVHDAIACIATGKEPNCSGDDGRHALEVAIAIRESHRQGGRRVALPLADRSLGMRAGDIAPDEVPAALRRGPSRPTAGILAEIARAEAVQTPAARAGSAA
jgi:predicted dehydrogenase